tara:strand:- start:61 stop:627 length:567 start_codon:yes stop_codon:yes gene_type:complete
MNKLPNIIAICGYKGSGKDTIANYLVEKYNYKHYKISTKVREVAELLFDLKNEDYENNKEVINDKWNVTPRSIMQFIGTDMFQYKIQELLPNIGRKFWIKTLLTDDLVNTILNNENNIVISDLRFLHEYEELKKINTNLCILRVSNINIKKNDNHISENEFLNIPIHYEIDNSKDIVDLYKNLNNILN